MRKKMEGRKYPEGVSIIIAIIFVSAFLLVIAGLYDAQMRAAASIRARESQGKAKYLGEAAFEVASYWAHEKPLGWNTDNKDITALQETYLKPVFAAAADLGVSDCKDPNPDPATNKSCVSLSVVGRARKKFVDGFDEQVIFQTLPYYSVPIRATGDAAPACGQNPNDADDPCHWNRVYFGESVEIPLYFEDEQGVIHKADLTNGNFKLRIRTPCKDPTKTDCVPADRVELYPQVSGNVNAPFGYPAADKDPVLVQWVINDGASDKVLFAYELIDIFTKMRVKQKNTEISGGSINDAKPNTPSPAIDLNDFIVLDSNMSGQDIYKVDQKIKSIGNMTKPILRLALISQPRKDDDNNPLTKLADNSFNNKALDVPYLEYQLLISDNAGSIADSKSVLTGWARILDFKKEWREYLKRPATLGGFALENF